MTCLLCVIRSWIHSTVSPVPFVQKLRDVLVDKPSPLRTPEFVCAFFLKLFASSTALISFFVAPCRNVLAHDQLCLLHPAPLRSTWPRRCLTSATSPSGRVSPRLRQHGYLVLVDLSDLAIRVCGRCFGTMWKDPRRSVDRRRLDHGQ